MTRRVIVPCGNLEKVTSWHVMLFAMGAAWMFGGKIDWAKPILIGWGGLGALLTLYGLIGRRQRGAPVARWLLWLTPPLLLATWVLVSSFNPSFEVVWYYEQQVFRPHSAIPWLPSSVLPALTRSELALALGLYLSAFNLALNTENRRTIRSVVLILGLNACVLALFGIAQKLAGTEMFFGWVESPNSSFFASFIYHNHWGPYALLNIAGWFGLIEYLAREDRGRGFLHSPGFAALIAILLISTTIPLSTSRSSTLMLAFILTVGMFWWLWRFDRQASGPAKRPLALVAGTVTLLLIFAAAFWVGQDSIKSRLADTREQIAQMKEMGGIGQRARVYGDSIRFIKTKPIAGWGLESYAFVYRRYNSEPKTVEGWTVQFNEAHSDWLQLGTEVGLVGVGLFLTTLGLPLWWVRHRLFRNPLPGMMFICLGTLGLYAWVEFPFANPAVTLSAWIAFFGSVRYLQLGNTTSVQHLHSREA